MDTPNNLVDLELLLLKIEDKEIRELTEEAIKCYYIGAYRASINSIWNAIIYDAYKKAKFLAENFGDKAAKKLVKDIENSIESGNYIKEFEIIEEYLYKKFKALDKVDLDKLEFIKKLRNLSSHPSFYVSEGRIFYPNAEDVRMCLRNAIEILLSKKPIIGKSAIEHILRDVEGPYTPLDYKSFKEYFVKKYINRADKYLLRNLFLVILKDLNRDIDEPGTITTKIWLLKLLIEKDENILYDGIIKNILNNFNIDTLIYLLAEIHDIFKALDEIIPKLKQAIKEKLNIKLNIRLLIFTLKYYKPLKFDDDEIKNFIYSYFKNLENKFELIGTDDIEKLFLVLKEMDDRYLKDIFVDFFIDNLINLSSFIGAQEFIEKYSIFLEFLDDTERLKKLFENIKLNNVRGYNQILHAGQRLYNIMKIFEHLPVKIVKENELIIEEFFKDLKENYEFTDERIEELRNLIKERIKENQ